MIIILKLKIIEHKVQTRHCIEFLYLTIKHTKVNIEANTVINLILLMR